MTTTPKPGWKHVAIGPALSERLGVPIAFELDVTAAAVGEQRWGAGEGAGSLCYLTVGTGIGAGLLIDGVPRHGLVHPEVGHMRIPHDRARDPFDGCCPVHGDCWEGLAGGPAIAARWGIPAPRTARPITRRGRSRPTTSPPGSSTSCSCSRPSASSSAGACSSIRRCSGRSGSGSSDLLGGYLDTPLLRAEEIESFLVPPALGDDAGVLGAIALARTLELSRVICDRTCERALAAYPASAPGARAREDHGRCHVAAVEHLDLDRLEPVAMSGSSPVPGLRA